MQGAHAAANRRTRNLIDPSSLDIAPSEYSDFRSLCLDIYDFVANEDHANLFKLKSNFPENKFTMFGKALDALISDSSISNGFYGFVAGPRPTFIGPDGRPEVDGQTKEGCAERIERIKAIDSETHGILSRKEFYNPAYVVEKTITSMGKGTQKTILEKFFIENWELDDIVGVYGSGALSTIDEFSKRFSKDPLDAEFFDECNVPSNVMIYLCNRSPAYYRLFLVNSDPGFGDAMERIFPLMPGTALKVRLFPNSEESIDLNSRAMSYLEEYMKAHEGNGRCFVSALLALFDNVPIKKTQVKWIFGSMCEWFRMPHPVFEEWGPLFDDFLETKSTVKFLSYDNIESACSVLNGIKEMGYGASVEKIYVKCGQELLSSGIGNQEELEDFLLKYTGFRVDNGRILAGGSLKEAIEHFIRDVKVYNPEHLRKLYIRRCGGPTEQIKPIIDSIDIGKFATGNELTQEEARSIEEKLSEYEWISKDNARSIFADLHELEDKFTEMNMHRLGFTSMQDVYFRAKYSSFGECVLKCEFVGDEIYVDERKFRLKMDCSAFRLEVENLERYLHWIPVSKYRYINLDSPKNARFAEILVGYKEKITELCKHQFTTPYSLKNMKIGIPEIDDDDYGIEFYDAMLIASRANHQNLAKQRFYFIPSDVTGFGATAPEFIRYIIYNNNGQATVSELQDILESEYGITANISVVRTQAKLSAKFSTCIFSEETDTAYLDSEIYMEAIRNDRRRHREQTGRDADR